MKHLRKWSFFALLSVGLVLVNYIAGRFPAKVDLTSARIYTLSQGSRDLLGRLDEPVTLRFYFSRSLEGLPIFFKNYATRVEDLLSQYVQASGGLLRLEVVDPRPDTPEEEMAVRSGVQGQPLPTGHNLFFGLVAMQAEQEAVIPVFTYDRESLLEYDISQLVYRVQQAKLPVMALFSGLDLAGLRVDPVPGQRARPPEEWVLLSELRKLFDVRMNSGATIPEETDILAVIHPDTLSEEQVYAIDQFVLSGRPVILAVDPSSVVKREEQPAPAMIMSMPPAASSDLPALFLRWGVVFDAEQLVGDPLNAATVSTGRGGPTLRYPVWLQISEFDSQNPVTAQLSSLLLPESGAFSLLPDSPATLDPLISTSAQAGMVPVQVAQFGGPEAVARELPSDGRVAVVAAILSGFLQTAFPDGPRPDLQADSEEGEGVPPGPPPGHLASSVAPARVALMGDVDFLSDRFAVQVMNFFGTRAYAPINDNLNFFLNVAEHLAGSGDLMSVRGKGLAQRPFVRVRDMELDAQTRYQAQLEALEARLAEVQGRIQELQTQLGSTQQLVASPEVREAIESYRAEEVGMRSERREIRRRLREDIDALKRTLAVANMLVVPGLVGLGGVFFFVRRNRRQYRRVS